ncbi:hypothetical protein AVEN_173614-1 [Araneus ventricosus]|uniref:Uncharacterized protein n=1 Tax=Araneus ventricosus TaxID=182803 RepID=A0A4Y2CQX8_ARAVE|nr:hypothetical protein AVEN_173614-1 [Araneus ventricosus]
MSFKELPTKCGRSRSNGLPSRVFRTIFSSRMSQSTGSTQPISIILLKSVVCARTYPVRNEPRNFHRTLQFSLKQSQIVPGTRPTQSPRLVLVTP